MRGRPPAPPVLVVVVGALLLVGCSVGQAGTDPTGPTGAPAAPSAPTGPTTTQRSVADPGYTPGSPSPVQETIPMTSQPPSTPAGDPALDQQLRDAAWANDVPAAQQLIAAGADVNAKDDTQQSAYLIATSEGHLELLELTLANSADLTSLDSYRGTGLIRAAERGHADIVGRLLQAGIDVNHVNRPEWTALDEAIVYGDGGPGYVDTVRALLAGGADLTRVAGDGRSPLQHAEDSGFGDIADLLRAGIAAPGTGVDQAAGQLLAAAAAGDADSVAIALRAGAPLEARDERGRTALLLAAAADRVEVARLLVALGADPDAQDDQQDSAWLVTGVTGSVPMLETLLPAGPDLALRNRFGGVSVIPASERGHVDYVRRVVSTGIDVNHVNDLGWTALLEAIVLGDGSAPYQEIVGILLDAGADPTIADRDGVTPLQHAQNNGYGIIAARLQSAGG